MFKVFQTKLFRSAPVVGSLWVLITAGILVEWQRFVPDLLFHPGL